ncbi:MULTISPECIES: LacI family DNA-binding transcriptional regulator [Hymenobacter]|uniref:LacI family transcriptional regulator n=1 Tax=Hymenobacter jejuensis TaxID=2502781 RepID=A0A5B8A2P6_9BACT|nr:MULTISPECIES: LacI family DNA-binding transcriptional regulator [Hymenobacter]MBC6989406.1 LacI family DNA-binding transcriptional regulator [Hymenobacter sp. BT491]QDA61437.1 LacI family transcriptional regulator [Hymenobacter jejuensis]
MSKDSSDTPISMSDLAKELGVSVTTISRALSDHFSIGPATKKRVQKLAKKWNYQPNHLASALRKGKSKLLGVMVPHIDGRFFPSVVHGIETAASKAGFSVLICQSNEDVTHERKNIETLMSAQVEGILVSLARTTRDFKHFKKVQKRGIPLVFFDRILESGDVNAVVLNDREGGYQSTKHLIEQGCRRIAHFAGPQQLNIYKNRRQGYLDALQQYNLPIEDELIVYCDMTLEAGMKSMEQLLALPNPPDAVFGAGDFSVMGALQLLKSRGMSVPQDVALVGFSNETFTHLMEPMITSVDQRCEQMGQSAVRLFLELLEEKGGKHQSRHVVLQPDLIVRTSSLRSEVLV